MTLPLPRIAFSVKGGRKSRLWMKWGELLLDEMEEAIALDH